MGGSHTIGTSDAEVKTATAAPSSLMDKVLSLGGRWGGVRGAPERATEIGAAERGRGGGGGGYKTIYAMVDYSEESPREALALLM